MVNSTPALGGDPCEILVESYAINERMNQIVLEHLDPAAWRARSGGRAVRTIAEIVAHTHNIRRKWIRLSAPHLDLPPTLKRSEISLEQARTALAESALRCSEMITDALLQNPRRVETFVRDGWARPWSASAAVVAYMISHEAHHRGQVCLLAHQAGFPLPAIATQHMWSWERLGKECGFTRP